MKSEGPGAAKQCEGTGVAMKSEGPGVAKQCEETGVAILPEGSGVATLLTVTLGRVHTIAMAVCIMHLYYLCITRIQRIWL